MTHALLDFDEKKIVQALSCCEGHFSSAVCVSAAERSWPFLERYLNVIKGDGKSYFRDLIDMSWRVSANDSVEFEMLKELLTDVERYIPDENQAKSAGFDGVLESTIVIVRSAEAALARSVAKSAYALSQSYALFDALVLASYQPKSLVIIEENILKHPLVQDELLRIYRDCTEITTLPCNTEIQTITSKFKQRAVQESEEIQLFYGSTVQ
jgi:Protein of unknown function (DUF416)